MQNQLENHKSARDLLLEKISSVLQADERFVAAWLTGSLGRHGGDPLSDIDITVVVDSQQIDNLCRRPWMIAGRTTEKRLELFSQFGEPVIIHENHHNAPENGTFTCVIYAGEVVTVDWTLVPQQNAIPPRPHVMLFNKTNIRFNERRNSVESREERAKAASEKVMFFWMMMTVVSKYMLRRDVVYFHILLDGLHRIVFEVLQLIDGRSWEYRSGSPVKLAVTYSEQVAAIRVIAARMLNLMSSVAELGGYVPDQPMRLIEHLLAFGLTER